MKKLQLNLVLLAMICSTLLSFKCQSSKNSSTTATNKILSPSKFEKNKQNNMDTTKIVKTDEEWKKILTDEEYNVLREAGTERPFTGKYTDMKADGNYYCKACGNLLFTSETKYHSGCGWPAFYDNAGNSAVEMRSDNSYGMQRIEVLCKKCGSHLGHIFEDGPKDKTGLRYCINSISLDFKEDSTKTK
ncbi:MAG TPA: peptide-methionine (R)-S-oxide reductase MsrB [Chitinophagales bacterium]|nr:peptide-methionine (R)-S-oxide reductase MsrB [Chitinophagales bacterium]